MVWLALLAFPVACVIAFIILSAIDNALWACLIAGAGLLFGSFYGCGYDPALRASEKTKTLTVNHKERTGGDNGKWLVFTNHGVYSVEDSLWLFKFDASDRYNAIRVGHTYRCRTAGWRIHFTSDYQNLIHCSQVHS